MMTLLLGMACSTQPDKPLNPDTEKPTAGGLSHSAIDPVELAAQTVLAQALLNFDEAIMRR